MATRKVVPLAVVLLRSCLPFGSKDSARTPLHGARVLDAHKIAATDGHRLIVIESDAAHGLPVGQIKDVKGAIKRIEVGATVEASHDFTFPDVSAVIPPLGRIDRGESLDTRATVINPRYMSEAVDALAGFAESVRITYANDDSSPLRIDGRGEGIRAIVVIMPVRARNEKRDPWFTDDPARCAA